MSTKLKALLFDVDGTLADTERDGHRLAFNQAFKALGLDWIWTVEGYGELLAITGGKERIRHYAEHMRSGLGLPDDSQAFIARIHQHKTQVYLDMLKAGGIPLRPGVKRLLAEARAAGIILAIATTTTPENVTHLLAATLGEAALGWFSVIAAGDVVPCKKPAPDIYHYTLKALGLPPEACLALEDSENGLQAARAAGIPTIITVNDYTHTHDFSGAEIVLSDFGEPDQPCRVVVGADADIRCLTLDILKRLHARAISGEGPRANRLTGH